MLQACAGILKYILMQRLLQPIHAQSQIKASYLIYFIQGPEMNDQIWHWPSVENASWARTYLFFYVNFRLPNHFYDIWVRVGTKLLEYGLKEIQAVQLYPSLNH